MEKDEDWLDDAEPPTSSLDRWATRSVKVTKVEVKPWEHEGSEYDDLEHLLGASKVGSVAPSLSSKSPMHRKRNSTIAKSTAKK